MIRLRSEFSLSAVSPVRVKLRAWSTKWLNNTQMILTRFWLSEARRLT